ncbi:MAG: diaminopimelate epimerase, partial [Clostridia bacterium]|nr:diaminopimelate epimerase [Clostridia bacterium]
MRFTKMEGLGNDYVYINAFEEQVDDPARLAVEMSRYHFGCGSDGLILIRPGVVADFCMEMYNSDGSRSEMCGNGIRCVAKYVHDRGLTDRTDFTIESGGQVKIMHLNLNPDGTTHSVCVDMGTPELDGAKIPSLAKGNPVTGCELQANDRRYAFTLVSMGNPHAVAFVDNPDTAPVTVDGPVLERDPLFPNRANIEFVQVLNRRHARMRVWERGTGETMACGTGACAVLVACVLNGLCDREADIDLPGGTLHIEWRPSDGHV